MQWAFTSVMIGFAVLFLLCMVIVTHWLKKQRVGREPFPDGTKVLRAPGEALMVRMQEFDTALSERLGSALLYPFVIFVVLAGVSALLPPRFLVPSLAIALLASLGCMAVLARRLGLAAKERRNCALGWFGERCVGDCLDPLKAQGWRIFHDVPQSRDTRKWNIDHVAVGPQGVFAIETKARRKVSPDELKADYKVAFDGSRLIWPRGPDPQPIEQAMANAKSLAEALRRATNESFEVQWIVTLPGWWVTEPSSGPLQVCNARRLPYALTQRRPVVLSAQQVDRVAASLDSVCRNVELA